MAKQTKALVAEAAALGIEVDGRWGDETIQEKIDEREAAIAAEAADGQGGVSPIAQQMEALTDGEGDPATGGEAGAGAGRAAEGEATVEGAVADGKAAGSVGPRVELAAAADPAGGLQVASEIVEERSGRAPEDTAAPDLTGEGASSDGEGDPATGGEAGTAEGAAELDALGTGLVDGAGEPEQRPTSTDGSQAEEPQSNDAGGEGATVLGLTDDPVAEAEDAPDDEDEDGEATDLGDGSAAGEDLPIFATNAYQSLKAPIRAAFDAADAVFDAFEPIDSGDTWFMPDSDGVALLVARAVPFVRTWPEAPIEALYLHTWEGVADVRRLPWSELAPLKRMAWEVFHDTLISIDRIVGVERARLLASEAKAVDIVRVPIDETTLETFDDPSALTEIGKAMQRRQAAAG